MTTDTKGYKSAGDSKSPPPERPERGLLTEKAAALRLGVSLDTVRRMRYSGKLDYVPIGQTGRGIRYDPEDLDLWIARNKLREPQ